MASSYNPDEFLGPPEPRTSVATIALCILNVLAVGALGYCLLLDFSKRQAWAYGVFLRDLSVMGLPLEEENQGLNGSRETIPKSTLTSEQLLAAYRKRVAGGNFKENFVVNDYPLPARILPRYLDDETLKRTFGDLKPYVKTLDEEVNRIQASIFDDMAKVAKDTASAEKTAENKRNKLREVLLPLGRNYKEVRALDAKRNDPKLNEAGLDDLLIDAVQRRMLLDILNPVEAVYLMNGSEPNEITLEKLKDKMKLRLANALDNKIDGNLFLGGKLSQDKNWKDRPRDIQEKRENIAFLLFAIAHATRPDGKYLYENGPERAQIVVGLFEFGKAAESFTWALETLKDNKLEHINRERGGEPIIVEGKVKGRTPAWVDAHPDEIAKIRTVLLEIELEKKNLANLLVLIEKEEADFKTRKEYYQDLSQKIVAARLESANKLERVRFLQHNFFHSTSELSGAFERNAEKERELCRLEEEIRRLEGILPKENGGKSK